LSGLYRRPFLKWAGGKYRLLDTLTTHIPKRSCLVEPFVGAGAVFLNVPAKRFILNDINPDLIDLYQRLQTEPSAVIEAAATLFKPKFNTPAQYYKFRAQFNSAGTSLKRCALFLYLNRHGYNGLCRYNLKGQFNVPFGNYLKPYFPLAEMQAFSLHTQKAQFTCQPFEESIKKAPRNAVIYCDPPYAPLSKTANFTGYAACKFSLEAQAKLAKAAVKATQKGCLVLISNHDTPFTRELYKEATCHQLEVQRVISCKGMKRQKVKELIAVYG
tara:strand:+ start:1146 stop:1961 length:816 start_codon:yes stop_codon:yes gene_type:complete